MQTVPQILSNYSSESPGIRSHLARLLGHGKLGGTGKILIQAVDQGFEHGPAQSFVDNFCAMDPNYHFEMACEAGISGYAAPMGWLQQSVDNFVGKIPLILKMNSGNSLYSSKNQPDQTVTASVDDALRLGCMGVGFTLYPGSDCNLNLMREAAEIIAEARAKHLLVILWSYPRGGDLSKEDESALDVVAYGAHMACLLGAHIVKVKMPSAHIALSKSKDVYEKIPHSESWERIQHIRDVCFKGKKIVIFSGGEKKSDKDFFDDIHAIHRGGGFGSIIGRNIFQRSKDDAITALHQVVDILNGKDKR